MISFIRTHSQNLAKRHRISNSAPVYHSMAKNAMSVTILSSTPHFSNVNPQVDAYEVLVEANFPTRWVYQPIPVPAKTGPSFA